MTITDDFLRVPLARIIVHRDDRQRRAIYSQQGEFLNGDGLLDSIRARGVINPLVVNREFVLVAGERRLEASRCAGRPDVPVRFVEDLSEDEAKVIELEENLKRVDLPWRDEVLAIAQLHKLYQGADPEQTQAETGRRLAVPATSIAGILRVARDINSPRIASATSWKQAYNVIARADERATADAVNDIIDAGADIFANVRAPGAGGGDGGADGAQRTGGAPMPGTGLSNGDRSGDRGAPVIPTALPSDSILLADFPTWAAQYSGPSFNFIHCDFPYGIGVFGGDMSGRTSQTTYDDSEETYTALITALCAHLPKLLSHSAHLMFWLTADISVQHKTIELFRRLAPSLMFRQMPLVWHKTDNVGILSDPKRGPRHVYETALVASQEDRLIVRSVSDTYGAPTDKSHHPSTKPEPVLRHFLSMYIDENSRVLDPTCGSGSALRAAESLGAKYVLGLERDPEHYKAAQSALRTFRTLRKVSK